MSYSYAAPGATGDHYQTMAQDVARKLYFAGEVCSKPSPFIGFFP